MGLALNVWHGNFSKCHQQTNRLHTLMLSNTCQGMGGLHRWFLWYFSLWAMCLHPLGPSIYDVHKKITFLTLPLSTCVHMGRTPPLWTSTHGRHEIHTTLLKWLVQ